MPYPHTIRLRGPWQFSVLSCITGRFAHAPHEAAARQGRINLPADWSDPLGADFRGRVRYSRHFNCPTGLDPHEQVWCVIDGIDPAGSVTLNDQPLGQVRGYAVPSSFNITPLLQDRNQLTLDVGLLSSYENETIRPGRENLPGGPVGEVRLEIRAAHSIANLSVMALDAAGIPELHVAGQVIGAVANSPLAVAVNVAQHELLYGEFLPGEAFQLHAAATDLPYREPTHGDCRLAAIEVRLLAGGAAVWQSVRETAVERVAWSAATSRLAVGGQSVNFPVPAFPATEAAPNPRLLAELQKQPIAVWGCRQILSDSWYTALDRHNLRVVQAMPPAWAAEVCSRLAHHPSIVAWSAKSQTWPGLPQELQAKGAFGRPWLKEEEAFDATS